jgi:hypothetical protein
MPVEIEQVPQKMSGGELIFTNSIRSPGQNPDSGYNEFSGNSVSKPSSELREEESSDLHVQAAQKIKEMFHDRKQEDHLNIKKCKKQESPVSRMSYTSSQLARQLRRSHSETSPNNLHKDAFDKQLKMKNISKLYQF